VRSVAVRVAVCVAVRGVAVLQCVLYGAIKETTEERQSVW